MSEQTVLHTIWKLLKFISEHPSNHVYIDGKQFADKTIKDYEPLLQYMRNEKYINVLHNLTDPSSYAPTFSLRFCIKLLYKGKELLKNPLPEY